MPFRSGFHGRSCCGPGGGEMSHFVQLYAGDDAHNGDLARSKHNYERTGRLSWRDMARGIGLPAKRTAHIVAACRFQRRDFFHRRF